MAFVLNSKHAEDAGVGNHFGIGKPRGDRHPFGVPPLSPLQHSCFGFPDFVGVFPNPA
jgi:hypothetical protein